jgi:hypothetical protein
MKNANRLCALALVGLLCSCQNQSSDGNITFYEVPLVCGAAPEIGCGSRIKPFFLDLQMEKGVLDMWTNREGTILAIRWDKAKSNGSDKIAERLFEKHIIEAKVVSDKKKKDSLSHNLETDQRRWLKGMAVDSLSLYEARVIAHTLTDFAKNADLINSEEHEKIRKDIESYFSKELVKVRTAEELNSDECQEEWRRNGFLIYQEHIGRQRAEAVSKYFSENELEIMKQESCCSENESCEEKGDRVSENSTITCPYCGFKKEESMPIDVCQIKYRCTNCKRELTPKNGDCCVFCSYGDNKCPSKQE